MYLNYLTMKNKKNNPDVPQQSKLFLLELYPEWKDFNKLIENIRLQSNYYAYIIHDKDVNDDTGDLKKPHCHCLIEFKNKRTVKGVYNLLNSLSLETRFIQPVYKSENSVTRYLLHLDDEDKYPYDFNEIQTNNPDRVKYHLLQEIDVNTQLNCLCEFLNENKEKYITTYELRLYAFNNGFIDAFNKYFYQLSTILKEHNKDIDYRFKPIQEELDRVLHKKQRDCKNMIDLANMFGTCIYNIDDDVYQVVKLSKKEKANTQVYTGEKVILDE